MGHVSDQIREGEKPDSRETLVMAIKKEEFQKAHAEAHAEALPNSSDQTTSAIKTVEVALEGDLQIPVKRGRGRPRGSKSKKRELPEMSFF